MFDWVNTVKYRPKEALAYVSCFSNVFFPQEQGLCNHFCILTAPSVRIKYTFTDTKAEICFIELKWYWILLSFIISITMTIIKVIHFEWDTQKNTLVES